MPSGGEGTRGLTPRVSNPLQSFSLCYALPGNATGRRNSPFPAVQNPASALVAREVETLKMEFGAAFST